MGEGWAERASSTSCRLGPRPCSRNASSDSWKSTRSARSERSLSAAAALVEQIGRDPFVSLRARMSSAEVQPGEILVTDKTDPDWEPTMKKASAIVTNRGGRTCHAAIVSRELGYPPSSVRKTERRSQDGQKSRSRAPKARQVVYEAAAEIRR